MDDFPRGAVVNVTLDGVASKAVGQMSRFREDSSNTEVSFRSGPCLALGSVLVGCKDVVKSGTSILGKASVLVGPGLEVGSSIFAVDLNNLTVFKVVVSRVMVDTNRLKEA